MPGDRHDDSPHVLLVNPWIHDFAAYDFWAKPMGLLLLAGVLRQNDICVSYIDCLDRFHPRAKKLNPSARLGKGPYLKTDLPYPKGLENIPRRYSRYGIPKEWLMEDLASLTPPDLIFVTSLMTYWYPGVIETISEIRRFFPDTPVVLGGIYATLCREHANKHSGANRVVAGPGINRVFDLVKEYTGFKMTPGFDPDDLNTWPRPAFDLQHQIPYITLMTSLGCPFSCTYCASKILNAVHMRRRPQNVVEEIVYWHNTFGTEDYAFYDDALLINPEEHVIPMLEKIIELNLNLRFHTPNALHVREISDKVARLMYQAGFHTIRLGVETASFSNREKRLDQKLTQKDFKRAVKNLKTAGFEKSQVGAYLLMGLPDESEAELTASIDMVKSSGITPVLAHYTPIPGTSLWPAAVKASRYDLESDPIFSNNAISPCKKELFSWREISRLKQLTKG